MGILTNKIDFIGFITVQRANPNGDPINGNQPRTNYDNYGEISDVCIKRKVRNRLQDMKEKIVVMSDERNDDGYDSIRSRVEGNPTMEKILKMKEKEANRTRLFADEACKIWIDVRAFGQVFALKKGTNVDAVSVGVRGPVSIHTAVSLDPVLTTSMQITKSVNGEPGDKKGSDTMGMKHRVEFGLYKLVGSINVQLAEKTGFSEADAEKIKKALVTLFENDASSARPEGSIEMSRFYWIQHDNKTGRLSSAKVHRSMYTEKKDNVELPRKFEDYIINDEFLRKTDGITIEMYEDGMLKNDGL
ncbi:type I-C CRISPR-associated protein Cas7/Csd2 [Pectinatus haikarae]|uniref:CRISPR-associated protein Csd2 n=1 Tax=Pectinatus haikarae TaxID=349096 RepID=A0ABT9YA90_9FIRM|nr:type I-C CRISPR-associated protein Cas7/Csd2 [Pectinatus haikarae]MDQ0204451.1 CRISPR-associated protein Csd2 [Pectinatus haikarae]